MTEGFERLERRLSASVLRLQTRSPFFATLALFSRMHLSDHIPTAATNGKDIFFNPTFIKPLGNPALDGLLLHEVLHAALLHVVRCQERDRLLWNIAADIVVNGMVAQQDGMEVPRGAVRDLEMESLSVEEIYELLQKQTQPLPDIDLIDLQPSLFDAEQMGDGLGKTALEAYWREAMQQAIAIAKSSQSQGTIPAGFEREFAILTEPQLDWRTYLWRFMVKTPTDFMGFDRRFIGQKLYLDTLDGESVKVYVAIDTSGSVGAKELSLFVSELMGILNAYPHLECELYYADAALYGPYDLTKSEDLPKPVGGGGTSFVPFFDKLREHYQPHQSSIAIYLTDGFAPFPSNHPNLPVLWVVTPGGLALKQFPFGEAVRLLTYK